MCEIKEYEGRLIRIEIDYLIPTIREILQLDLIDFEDISNDDINYYDYYVDLIQENGYIVYNDELYKVEAYETDDEYFEAEYNSIDGNIYFKVKYSHMELKEAIEKSLEKI